MLQLNHFIYKYINLYKKNFLKNILLMILVMAMCTIVSIIFNNLNMSETNIVMIYLLGILLYSYMAEGYVYSFFASVGGVLLYNFFFTEPYYTLQVYSPDYPIIFLVMFIVGSITSMLTIRVKIESQLVVDREKYISSLYYVTKRLLDVKSCNELAEISADELSKQFNADVLVSFFNSSGNVNCRIVNGEDVFNDGTDYMASMEAYQSGSPCGCGTTLFSGAKAYYSPILSHNGSLGVIGISLRKNVSLVNTQRTFIDVISRQIAVVLERERIYEKQQKTQIEIQKERLRSDILRSISHDLRTPLAGIMGLASTAHDNYEKLSDEVKITFLQSIYEDADWLNELVENILQTTRFEEGRIKLNIKEEAAEEIITEAVTHVKKHSSGHEIHVKIPDEIIILQVDGILIRQVIINLLNNAINYSPRGSKITVSLFRENNNVVFEVSDNGPGISQEEISHIFERYYQRSTQSSSNRKGMGLGLSLCKSIIEAHNGEISMRNNVPNGTIVSFYIKSGEENVNGAAHFNS
ncbi:Sensor protein KdpD [bioreactor metagenome]|uniref:histidine kinase n=1 Tax=bioreactor metagenome TaxID=1076179 RepID=A0A644WU27_9ZZZZ